MAKIKRFEDRMDEFENVANNSADYLKAVNAARFFACAVDALQVEFEPETADGAANKLYYSMIRDYLREEADDIGGFIDDDDAID